MDRLVAERRDADPLPAAHQLDRHPRARAGLARAGRPLHEEVAVIEARRGLDRRHVEPRPRRPPLEDIDERLPSAVGEVVAAKRRIAAFCSVSTIGATGISAVGQRLVRALDAAPEPDEAALVVDADGVALLGRRIDAVAADLVLLRRERERVDERLSVGLGLADELELRIVSVS